ncbi:hypothetical protein [Nocardia cyriacigeorgica]|uniref:hypothetical protein n=1 Tax=Nocardia cyriacigeorgica TaxID=135487 RepID=UPI002455CE51|nr:hypothetical protein [Nocardia cyriacigeorgica]
MRTTTSTRARRRRGTRIGIAVTGLGAAAAAFTIAAPTAGAGALGVNVQPGMSIGLGTPYGTGCSYQVTASVDNPGQPVHFSDNGTGATFNPNPKNPTGLTATTTWTPATPGTHAILAWQGGVPSPPQIIVVGTGINTGSGCAVMP